MAVSFLIQDGLKKDVLSHLLVNFILEYGIKKLLDRQKGLESNSAH
jgi:hypothetical protein